MDSVVQSTRVSACEVSTCLSRRFCIDVASIFNHNFKHGKTQWDEKKRHWIVCFTCPDALFLGLRHPLAMITAGCLILARKATVYQCYLHFRENINRTLLFFAILHVFVRTGKALGNESQDSHLTAIGARVLRT